MAKVKFDMEAMVNNVVSELADGGFDIHDEDEVLMGLGACLGYDREDAYFILDAMKDFGIIYL